MSTVLWLASWYPNKKSPFSGDFIQRQALATAGIRPISLIFVTSDVPGGSPSGSSPAVSGSPPDGSFREYLIYYPKLNGRFSLFSRLFSFWQYVKQHFLILQEWRKSGGKPDLIHVQVAMNAGLIALYLKKRYGIPYVITEHWTGYLAGSRDGLRNRGLLFRFLLKKIIQHASCFLPVSRDLGEVVNQTIARVPTQVIPNVVDIALFHDRDNPPGQKFRFIHVSSLLPQKNPEGIISAFEKLTRSGTDAELVIVGPPNASVSTLLEEKKWLKDRLWFTGEITYAAVAEQVRKSSAFVLFSEVENLPCVLLEALCCGVPVISSRVGGIAEVIGKENGVLIDPGDESQLEAAMKQMISGYSAYDQKSISRNAQALYNYKTVGEQIARVYDQVLGENNQPFLNQR